METSDLPISRECHKRRHYNPTSSQTVVPRYQPCTLLGRGSYGDVFQCWDTVHQKHVAIKQFIETEHNFSELPQSPLREISILKRCNHFNIMPILDTLFDKDKQIFFEGKYIGGFVMPMYSGGDLDERIRVLKNKTFFSVDENINHMRWVRSMARQLYSALCYLHQRSIVHRDIKPANCMLDSSGEHLTICDFGLGRQCSVPLGPTYTTMCCTLWYRPPDLLFGSRRYGVEIDLWSAAVVVCELIRKSYMFPGTVDCEQIMLIVQLLGTPTEQTWPGISKLPDFHPHALPRCSRKEFQTNTEFVNIGEDGIDFINQTLVCCPVRRLSAKKALEHPFLNETKTQKYPQRRQVIRRSNNKF